MYQGCKEKCGHNENRDRKVLKNQMKLPEIKKKKKTKQIKAARYGATVTLIHFWWECK